MAKIRLTWTRSGIGYAEDQKRTLKALGLHRLNQTVEHEATPAIKGMIAKVQHLVRVENIDEAK